MLRDLISDFYLSEKEVIEVLRVSKVQFSLIKRAQDFSKPIEIKQNIKKYRIDEIISWKETQEFSQRGGL